MSGTYTVAQHVDSLYCCLAIFAALIACTLSGCTSLCVHQIDVGYTHIGKVGLKSTTPVVHTVILVALVRNELLAEISCTRTVVRIAHQLCCRISTISRLQWQVLINLVVLGRVVVDKLESVEHDVMIESWVAILKRMCRVETRLRIIKRQTICHTVCIVDIVSSRHVDDSVVLNKAIDFRSPQLGKVPVRTIVIGHRAAHHSFHCTWHLPVLTCCIEYVREVGRTVRLVHYVVIDISIFILGKSIRSCSAFNKAKSLTKGIGSTLCQFSIILISKCQVTGTG